MKEFTFTTKIAIELGFCKDSFDDFCSNFNTGFYENQGVRIIWEVEEGELPKKPLKVSELMVPSFITGLTLSDNYETEKEDNEWN